MRNEARWEEKRSQEETPHLEESNILYHTLQFSGSKHVEFILMVHIFSDGQVTKGAPS